jgi:uncharacterized repeat protein (TIGR04138 family)
MLCERCQERDATVFTTHCTVSDREEESTTTQRNLCEPCFEIENPEGWGKMQAELESGCRYCGRKEGATTCSSCLQEFRRFMDQKGYSFSREKKKMTADALSRMQAMVADIEQHMKAWVARGGPDQVMIGEECQGLRPNSLYKELVAANPRFTINACRFVHHAVHAAASITKDHVSGREVAEAFRSLALREMGAAALSILSRWGIRSTDDIGAIVFTMVEFRVLGVRPEDSLDDFHAVYDFATAFPTA